VVLAKDEELQGKLCKVNKITKLFKMRIYTKRKKLTVFLLNNSIRVNMIAGVQIID
jgi:hypothetical protein